MCVWGGGGGGVCRHKVRKLETGDGCEGTFPLIFEEREMVAGESCKLSLNPKVVNNIGPGTVV